MTPLLVGTILCDDIELLYHEDLRPLEGVLSDVTKARLETALKAAFGMRY